MSGFLCVMCSGGEVQYIDIGSKAQPINALETVAHANQEML